MLREEVLTNWTNLKTTLTELKELILAEGLFSTQANLGTDDAVKLVWIKDPENHLKEINLTKLPNLRRLRLTYSSAKEPSLTSITVKDCAGSVLDQSHIGYSDLWTKSKYFRKVKFLTLHYLPQWCFPKPVIDFSAYPSLERLTVEIAHGHWIYEKIVLKAPNLKILNWRGGGHLEKIEGLEPCQRLEIVSIRDMTVSKEVGELLKNHPRYQWACQNKGEDSWEWVVKKDKDDWSPNEGPEIEEVD